MKKQQLNLAIITLIAIALTTSCGNKSKQSEETKKNPVAKVKPDKLEISGDLADYLQIVNNEYDVTGGDYGGGSFSIKIKALKPLSAKEIKNNSFDLSVSLLSDNGMPVSGTNDFKMDYSSQKDKLISLLKKGSGEEIIQFYANASDYNAKEHADKVKKFTVSSSMKEKEKGTAYSEKSDNTSTTGENNSGNENVSSNDNQNWDQILKDYDEYTTKYIALIKKARNNDLSALSEYPDIYEQATKFGEELQGAQGNLSASQLSKMMKIQTKLAKAALEMSN